MKKLFALIATASLILIGASPVQAGTSTEPATGGFVSWSSAEEASSLSITIGGSLIEGETYSVTASGRCPITDEFIVNFGPDLGQTRNGSNTNRYNTYLADASTTTQIATVGGWDYNDASTVSFQTAPVSFTAGAAGTARYFVVSSGCAYYQDGVRTGSWAIPFRSPIVKVTFESAEFVSAPTNLTVRPGETSATIRWESPEVSAGLDRFATVFTVVSTPATTVCTTLQNGCTFQNLTPNETYSFSIVANNTSLAGVTYTSPVVTSEPRIIRLAARIAGTGLLSDSYRVGSVVESRSRLEGSAVSISSISWYRCVGAVDVGAVVPANCSIISGATGSTYVLSSADVGLYVTTLVTASNFFSSDTKISQNFQYPTLASDQVGSPINFSVFPQAAGTAFATWGIANGATSYTVSAGGRSCSTTENFCTITGLVAGSSYVFSVVATNGAATSPAVTSESIVLREPVSVALGLNGGTWRVGETVSAQYVLQGSNATPIITWHRCNSAVFAMPSPPVGNCSVVGSGPSYVLGAGDVGKFVTANVFVNNTDPLGQMTASSSNAVISSGAVAPPPVADPEGKPTIVNIPNPIVSVAGGTQVTITGTGLAGVIDVAVGGLPAIVVSKTDTTLVVQVPISTKVGLADLTITNAQGSVTSQSAIVYTTNPVVKITKTRTLTGFTANQRVLTNSQKAAVRTLLTANPTLTELACAAKTTGVKASKAELAKARTLATATCTYAKSLKKTLVTKSSATQTLPKAKASRTVLLSLKN
jgi:hypothetical protein